MISRCSWSEGVSDAYLRYHDTEWGVPVRNDRKHFEFLILEGAQAGLSWSTVLHKRDGYRRHYANFDPRKVAGFDAKKIRTMLKDPAIIRNRAKVHGSIASAQAFLEIQKEFGSFNRYAWTFVGGKPIRNKRRTMKDIPATTPESDSFSKDLKARGFKFVGSTIIYAHMQAVGMVNDHVISCFRYKKV